MTGTTFCVAIPAYPKAVAKIIDDVDELLTFYDSPRRASSWTFGYRASTGLVRPGTQP